MAHSAQQVKSHRHSAQREAGQRGGRKTPEALARLHSARVAQSRRRASLPGAGGRRLPLWGGAPSRLIKKPKPILQRKRQRTVKPAALPFNLRLQRKSFRENNSPTRKV